MKHAYIDTSWLIRTNFEDPGGHHQKRLRKCDAIFSSELLIAELLAFGRREGIAVDLLTPQLKAITFVLPDRSLRPEIEKVAGAGDVRGADLWHLACACYLTPGTDALEFLTVDQRQKEVAALLGFKI